MDLGIYLNQFGFLPNFLHFVEADFFIFFWKTNKARWYPNNTSKFQGNPKALPSESQVKH